MQKALVIAGLVILVAGLAWPWLKRLPFGRLPGDFVWRGEHFTFYFPLMTMIVLSLVVSVLFRLFR